MPQRRTRAIQDLRQEAENLRKWADATLAETQRVEPYMLASRLEALANALATEPVWQRLQGEMKERATVLVEQAVRGVQQRWRRGE